MKHQNRLLGSALALSCLAILAAMPLISDSRPAGSDALFFAVALSLWQLVLAAPVALAEAAAGTRGIFGARIPNRGRTVGVVLATGSLFGLSTFLYVLAIEKNGPVAAAIALQAYPLFAILWETLFLNRRKTPLELLFTGALLLALYSLATGGSWRVDGLSPWFAAALGVPFLWSVAHVILREVLTSTPVTPAQVTLFRVAISALFLGGVLLAVSDAPSILRDALDPRVQWAAAAMGVVYYLELILWFYAMRHIDVSLASSITVPAPAVTMAVAALALGAPVAAHEVAALGVVIACVYGLMAASARGGGRKAARTSP